MAAASLRTWIARIELAPSRRANRDDTPSIGLVGEGGLRENLGADLLHDLLLLDQECAHDTVLDTVCATGTTIGTLDGLLGLGDLRVLAGAKGGDLEGLCQYVGFCKK